MQCLLCAKTFSAYEPYGIPEKMGKCPHCGSKPRHRELAWFFQNKVQLPAGSKVLEVGPSKVQARFFAQAPVIGEARYTGIDIRQLKHHELLRAPHRFMEMDVTKMTFSDQSFEVILCNHVLPYIRSDYQAMSEIHRCLKNTGFAILNVSIQLPKTRKASEMGIENPKVYTEEYRAENGSEWVYGEDYFERLEAAGFFHHRLLVSELAGNEISEEQRFRKNGELILAFKYKDAMDKFLGGL